MPESKNIDPNELNKFKSHASHWWDPDGALKTLHQVNPIRLEYIKSKTSLAEKKVLDIGCGGGILAESMAKCGANVTGIDMSEDVIEVAKLHLLESKLPITYLTTTAEDFAIEQAGTFDMITCMEMLEHVPSPESIIESCSKLIKPGGSVFFSTLNRNPKSYLFAILGAEYILNLIPRNTHDYAKFIKPSELAGWARKQQLIPTDMKGIHYNPLTKAFKMNSDTSVNYLIYAKKQS